jgi:succinate dehydrogenase/fumarate reductase-like Fe-S protein
VGSSRFRALSYLGYRALVAHPFKRMLQEGTGLERFLEHYAGEGLAPTRPEDRAVGEAASACISCGLCEVDCGLAGAAPAVRALGLHAAFRLYGRSSAELPRAREALEACARCDACEASCPTGVPISRIARHLLAIACQPRPAAP